MTSSPSLRMNTSSVEKAIAPYTTRIRRRVPDTCLQRGLPSCQPFVFDVEPYRERGDTRPASVVITILPTWFAAANASYAAGASSKENS